MRLTTYYLLLTTHYLLLTTHYLLLTAAALRLEGITADDLAGGYGCDPATKSDLRIAAKPDVVVCHF